MSLTPFTNDTSHAGDDPPAPDQSDVRIDPALGIAPEAEYLIRQDAESLIERITPFMTSNYSGVLTAEIVTPASGLSFTLIRAATGDEAAELLSADDEDEPDSAHRELRWQQTADTASIQDPAVVLWSGEVLLTSGRGIGGPFYTHQTAATAWAFSTALTMPKAEVFGAQLVQYACAKSMAAGVLANGDVEEARLRRFLASPLRSVSVLPIPLPGRPADVG